MSLIECIQDQGPYYRKLKVEIESETNVKNELRTVKSNRQSLEKQITEKKVQVTTLEELSKKEYKDVRKMRNLSLRSAAATLSGKKKEKIEKEEAKYQLAFENEQKCKRALEELRVEYDVVVSKEAQLLSQMSQFVDIRLQFDSLIKQIFQLEDQNFPQEPKLKAELRSYKEQNKMANRDKGRFKEARLALTAAVVETKKVIRILDTVINYVPFEIFGGPVIDEDQIAYIEVTRRKIWAIQRLMNIARTVLPEIPCPQTLDVVTNNNLLTMRLDINYIDISWKSKTTQCFTMLATAYRNTRNALKWVEQYEEYASAAVVSLSQALERVKTALWDERIRIIELVLSGQVIESRPSGYDMLPTAGDDLAPPVYEAPPPIDDLQTGQSLQLPSVPVTTGSSPVMPSLPELPAQHSSLLDDMIENEPVLNQPETSYISHNVNNPFQTK